MRVTPKLTQQDDVDNATYNYLCELAGKEIAWNIDTIAQTREHAIDALAENHDINVSYQKETQ